MKVGTDGVLLGAWADVRAGDRHILDIGTGTGLIALMMAQRVPRARIMGIDVEDVSQARENADASPWSDRVFFEQCAVQEFAARPSPCEPGAAPAPRCEVGGQRTPAFLPAPQRRFDLIVSNPPFFVYSLTSPDRGRTTARHAVQLPFDELRDAVESLLAPGGRFAVILPAAEAERFIACCDGVLRLVRRTDVRTTPHSAVKRVLMEFVDADAGRPATAIPAETSVTAPVSAPAGVAVAPPPGPIPSELTIGTGGHECYTPCYRALTRDFYLKF